MSKAVCTAKRPQIVDLEPGKTYFYCTCGLSSKGALCDGSHKGGDFRPSTFTVDAAKKYALCQCKVTDKVPFCDGQHSQL